MNVKICSKCGIEKDISCFGVNKAMKDGFRSHCKECQKKYYQAHKSKKAEYYQNNKEKISEKSKEYKKNNREKFLQKRREYYKTNKEKISEQKKGYYNKNKEKNLNRNKEYYKNNRDEFLEQQKEYYKNNKEKISQNNKQYRKNNRKKCLEKQKEYRVNNKEKISKSNKEYRKNNRKKINEHLNKRYKEDKIYKLASLASSYARSYLKNNKSSKNGNSFWKSVPYTTEELKNHLESLWEPWMNWDNHGIASTERRTWNIDHIIPQSKLPYKTMNEPNFQKCWALENLRPLEAIENIKKRDKIIDIEPKQ